MWSIFARLLAFWQGGEPQTTTATRLHFWRKARERAQGDAGEAVVAERKRFWERGAALTRAAEENERTAAGGFLRRSAAGLREDAQPMTALWQDEGAEAAGELHFSLPGTAKERLFALPTEDEAQDEGTLAAREKTAAAETAQKRKTEQDGLFSARLWQGEKAAEEGERQRFFAMPVAEVARTERRLIPFGEKKEEKAAPRITAEEVSQGAAPKAAQEKAEAAQTIDVDALMRQFAQRLWQEREGSSRKRYG